MFEITVNVPGLEKLTEVLERLLPAMPPSTQQSISPVTSVNPTTPVVTPAVSAQTQPAPTAVTAPPEPITVNAPVAPTMPTTPAPAPAAPAVPTTAQTYTMEQLAVAATQVMDAAGGSNLLVVNLLDAFGVQALTQLPKERYGEFATALRQMGAKL